MDPIYLDNNATTPVLPEVADRVARVFREAPGNPASAHSAGRKSRRILEDAREQLAGLLGAFPDEVVFTSGGTESNNLALAGLVGAGPVGPGRLLASAVEHPSVLEPLRRLAETGRLTLTLLPVTPTGSLDLSALPAPAPDDRVVAVQLANHEVGAVQPVAGVAAHWAGVPVHCDAAQAVGKLATDFHALGVASLAASAHKFHGPPGVGLLLVRRGVPLRPLAHGGGQQQGRRPGTEPVALVAGMALALDLATRERPAREAHVRALRSCLLERLRGDAAPVVLNGPEVPGGPGQGVPHTLNLSFPGLEAASLLMALDLAGVACSAGSACSSGSLLPSPVVRALGAAGPVLRSAIRLSLSHLTTIAEVEESARRISSVAGRLRRGTAGGT